MGLIGSLLPIIIMLVLIGLVVFSINRVVSRRNKYINRKRIYWMLGVYVVVLLVTTALFFRIPTDQDIFFEGYIDLNTSPNLDHITSQYLLDEASAYIVSEKEFRYEKDELNIQVNTSNGRYDSMRILVERKDEADQMVEATVYQTPTFINHLNISEYIDPIQVDLTLSTLLIDGIWTELSYASFRTGFPFRQFEENRQLWFDEDMIYGQQLLFLRVPQDVEIIEKENVDVVYLEEKRSDN